ncbi:reverse transcriptase domain-containing protein [Tanacetum coccineum]
MANNINNQGPPPVGPNILAPDLRPMEELLQAPTDGVGDAIIVPPVLVRAAWTWVEKEPPNSITTWNDLVSKFMNYFFPPSRTTNLRNEITRFQQRFGESFTKAWDRFKDLLNKCPHYSFSPLHQIDTFYNGLNQSDQDSLNYGAGGNFLTRNTQEALTIIKNKSKVRTSRNKPQDSSASGSSSQNDAPGDDANKHLDKFLTITQSMKQNRVSDDALRLYLFPYSLTHHATAWFDRLPKNSIHTFQEMALKFLSKYFPPSMVTKLRNDISNFEASDEFLFDAWERGLKSCLIENMTSHHNDWDTSAHRGESSGSTTSSSSEIAALAHCGGPHSYYECQAAGGYTQDVYATTGNYNSGSALPSNTVPNLKEQINSITTRSGLTTAEPSIPPHVPPTPREEVEKEPKTLMDEVHITSPTSTAHVPPLRIQPVSPPKPKEDPEPNLHQPKIPYPSRLNKTKLLDKNDVQVSKFLKILKQLHFDINLMDALTQIPKYHKVLKDLLKDKEKLEKLANTPINVECSAILLNKVPEKLGDPEKFLIPCVLQDLEVCNSLADSRASINLMPLSIYEKLRVGPLKPTQMTLELDNRSVTYPRGIAEDVIVKVDKFNFLADFVIVDFEADHRVPITLGRPFLRTAKALIDFYEKSSGSTTSHSDHSLLDYEAFYFDVDHIKEKTSGSTTSHSDLSLLEYVSFHFDFSIDPPPIAKRSNSHHEEFTNELAHIISPPKYDHFYFDLEADPG